MKTKYVCGYIFNNDNETVFLIKKRTPAVHYGLWNGIGREILSEENSISAMVNSCVEIIGVKLNWKLLCTLDCKKHSIDFYTSCDTLSFDKIITKEECCFFNVSSLPVKILDDVQLFVGLYRSEINKPVFFSSDKSLEYTGKVQVGGQFSK